MDVLKETEKKMQAVLDHLKQEFRGLRTGRANPAMVENVMVAAYGSQMRLADMATITVPEGRQLLITPFDPNNVHLIIKAVDAANLNVKASADGNVVRIRIPEMDASVRQERVKQAKRLCEETKVKIRNTRRDANDTVKKQQKEGHISEDILKKNEKKIQELTDQYCKKADEMTQEKEKEILTV